MKTRIVKSITHHLYDNIDEFREYQPNVSLVEDWRHSNKGDWVLCDDGQVCQVLHLGVLKRKGTNTNTFIRTVIGSFVCSDSVKMDGNMRTNMHTFAKDGESPTVRRKKRKKANEKEFLFASYVAKGDDVVKAYMNAFPSNNEKYSEQQAKMLLKTERVQNLIREEIDKHLQEAEITPKYLLEEMRNIIDKPDSSDRDRLSALNTLIKITGMLDTSKTTETVALFQGFSKEQLDAIQESKYEKISESNKITEK